MQIYLTVDEDVRQDLGIPLDEFPLSVSSQPTRIDYLAKAEAEFPRTDSAGFDWR